MEQSFDLLIRNCHVGLEEKQAREGDWNIGDYAVTATSDLLLKDYHTATEMVELADKELPQKFVRRRGLIPIMYAQILLDTGNYEGALTYANDALSIAKELN